jgi:hypothetical protein
MKKKSRITTIHSQRFRNDENNWWEQNLVLKQIDESYLLSIIFESGGVDVPIMNQRSALLGVENEVLLSKDNFVGEINEWLVRVNVSLNQNGSKWNYDLEEIILKCEVFIKNINEILEGKKLKKTVVIAGYTFDTMVWTVSEYLCCDIYHDGEVYLSIKMNEEIDSDDDGSVLERYGVRPEGLSDEEIELEDFEYILPEEVNGRKVWYDGFILWSDELIPSALTEILPYKVTFDTTVRDINTWLKGNKIHVSYLEDREITLEHLQEIRNCLIEH